MDFNFKKGLDEINLEEYAESNNKHQLDLLKIYIFKYLIDAIKYLCTFALILCGIYIFKG
jgi:hypothetical protein